MAAVGVGLSRGFGVPNFLRTMERQLCFVSSHCHRRIIHPWFAVQVPSWSRLDSNVVLLPQQSGSHLRGLADQVQVALTD